MKARYSVTASDLQMKVVLSVEISALSERSAWQVALEMALAECGQQGVSLGALSVINLEQAP